MSDISCVCWRHDVLEQSPNDKNSIHSPGLLSSLSSSPSSSMFTFNHTSKAERNERGGGREMESEINLYVAVPNVINLFCKAAKIRNDLFNLNFSRVCNRSNRVHIASRSPALLRMK